MGVAISCIVVSRLDNSFKRGGVLLQAVHLPACRVTTKGKPKVVKPFIAKTSDGSGTYSGESRLAERQSAVAEASSAESTHVPGDRDTINATHNIVFVTAEVGSCSVF